MSIVKKVFRNIDLNDDGKMSKEEAEIFYRPEAVNQDYIQGNITKEDSITQFFSYLKLDHEGYCTWEEFKNYYTDVSSVTGKDENFVNVITNTWGINEGAVLPEECVINDFVKLLREKLIGKTNGVLDEYKLREMFSEYDREKSGLLTKIELQAMAVRLGLEIPDPVVYGLFKRFSSHRGDFMEFNQFNQFILYDTYK